MRFIREPKEVERNSIKPIGSNTITLGGFAVNLTGDMSGLSIIKQNTPDGGLILNIKPTQAGYYVNDVATNGSATITKTNNGGPDGIRIKISAPTTDVSISFSGVSDMLEALSVAGNTTGLTVTKNISEDGYVKVVATPTSSVTYAASGSTVSEHGRIISEQLLADGSIVLVVAVGGVTTLELQGVSSFMTATTAPDGVYYVWSGGRLANVGGTYCEGVALINKTKNQRFMIEKNEDNNPSYAAAHLAYNGSNITLPNPEFSPIIKSFVFIWW